MRQNRRIKNRQYTTKTTKPWKRILAVMAAATVLLAGMDLSGLEIAFAEEKSGYKIEVSYTEDHSQATLAGNEDGLAQGVTLVSITDAEGKEYNPSEFSYPTTENGDYTFTVDYKVEEEASVREEKEELTVTVDGIQKAEIEANTEPKTEEVVQSESAESPERMAVSELLARAQNTENEIQSRSIPVYTAESNLRLGSAVISYSGGKFSDELTGELTDYPGRVFDYAYFILSGDDTEFPLLGLYPLYNTETQATDWYYILEGEGSSGNTGSQNPATGDIGAQVAIELPEDAEVRVKYKVTTQAYSITAKYITPENTEDTDPESIKRWDSALVAEGRATEQIIVTFTLPAEYTSAIVEIAGTNGQAFKTFNTANAKNTGLEENVGGIDGRYSGVFSMKSEKVTVTFKAQIAGETNYQNFGFAWPRSEGRDLGNYQTECGRTYASINTDSKGNPEYKVSYLTDINRQYEAVVYYWRDPNYRPGSQQSISLYDAYDVVKPRRIAQGQYEMGETQSIQIQYERPSMRRGNFLYTYIPTVLDFYVYKGVTFGTDPSNENVLMEQISLPQKQGETVRVTLETGGTVEVTLSTKKNRTASQHTPDKDLTNDEYSASGSENTAHPYWVYDIKVSGTRYPYVVSLLDDSGAQEGFVIKEMTGVEEGETKTGGSVDTEYSTYVENRDNAGRKEYPLRHGSVMWKKFMDDTHPDTSREATSLHLVPKMGYGWPTISLENAASGQQAGRDKTPQKTSGGKTYYTHYISSASTGGNYRDQITSVKIVAEPIKLNVKYVANGGGESSPSSGAGTLQPSSDRYYSVILQDNLLTAGNYMNGYTLTIKNSKNQEINIKNPDDGNGRWYPGDILDVQNLYWEMASATTGTGEPFLQQGQGNSVNTYTMTFTASISSQPGEGSYGNVSYKIRTQDSYSPWTGNPSSTDHEIMYSDGFASRTDSVMAYIGSRVLLRNYPEKIVGPPNYILSGYSETSVIAGTQSTMDLVYLLGVQVEFTGLQTNHSETLVKKPGSNDTYIYAQETWFTGMDSHDNVINLNSINPGDAPANKQFAGWKITNSGGNAYNNGNPITGQLNLHTIGTTNSALWNQIFLTDGAIKLEAQWEDATKPITLLGGSYVGTEKAVKLRANSDGSSAYSLSAEFEMEGQVIGSAQQAYYAIYGQNEQTGTSPDQAWYKIAAGKFDNIQSPVPQTVPNAATGNNYWGYLESASVTVKTTYDSTGDKTNITLEISNITKLGYGGNHKNWRIYMWNSANGAQTANSLNQTFNNTSALEAVFPATQYPYNLEEIILLYPFANSTRTVDSQLVFDYTATEYQVPEIPTGGDENNQATLQATFKYAGRWTDYVGESFYIALYRTGNNAQAAALAPARWVNYTGTVPAGTSGSITLTGLGTAAAAGGMNSTATYSVDENAQTFTISFKLQNASDNKLRYIWEDATGPSARVWKIYAWNICNANGTAGNVNTNPSTTPGGEAMTLAGDAKVPCVDNKLHITPKAVSSSNTGTMHISAPKDNLLEGTDITVTANFNVDPLYPIQLQTGQTYIVNGTTYDDPDDVADGRAHWAVLKQNPKATSAANNANPWDIWAFDGYVANGGRSSAGNKISGSITGSGSTITVTYTIKNVNKSMTWKWEDGAKYEVFAWNGANHTSLAELQISQDQTTADKIEALIQQGRATAIDNPAIADKGVAYDVVPSVITQTNLVWGGASGYVKIPQVVSLTEGNANVTDSTLTGALVGGEVLVEYLPLETQETTHPVIDVDVTDSISMTGTGGSMTARVYDESGKKVPTGGSGSLLRVGTLSSTTSGPAGTAENMSFTFWLNAIKPDTDEGTYSGNMTYTFTARDYVRQ